MWGAIPILKIIYYAPTKKRNYSKMEQTQQGRKLPTWHSCECEGILARNCSFQESCAWQQALYEHSLSKIKPSKIPMKYLQQQRNYYTGPIWRECTDFFFLTFVFRILFLLDKSALHKMRKFQMLACVSLLRIAKDLLMTWRKSGWPGVLMALLSLSKEHCTKLPNCFTIEQFSLCQCCYL